MATIPSLKFNAVEFKPIDFTPVQYKSQTDDPNILPRSLQLQEAREAEAYQNLTNIDTVLSKARDTINPAEYDWLHEKATSIQKSIDEQLDLGRTGTAIKIARQAGRDLLRDTELQNKIRANNIYQNELAKVKQGNYDKLTKLYYEANNPYYDDGSGDWKEKIPIEQDVPISNILSLAAQLKSEKSRTVSNNKSYNELSYSDENGEETEDVNAAYGVFSQKSVTRNYSFTYQQKTKQELEKTFRGVLNDPRIGKALNQKFRVAYWAHKYYNDQRNDETLTKEQRDYATEEFNRLTKELQNKDGVIINDYDEWINEKVVPMFENMEYYNTSRSTTKSDNFDPSGRLQRNINKRKASYITVTEDAETLGTPIEVKVSNESSHNASDYSSLFE